MALRDVIGQERARDILLRTLARDRVPSAYLFAGESGIGKKFAALNLAKALNCLERDAGNDPLLKSVRGTADDVVGDACDRCVSCMKMDAMSHPDLAMIAPEKGEIRVGEIREVEEILSFKPFEGRRKVVIIDDADTMNQSAANAFLKTLEEPPEESLLILVTAHPDRLPETIRSRCSRINFGPLSPVACEEVVRRVSSGDRRGDEGPERMISLLIKLSMGRPGLVISSDLEKERERFLELFQGMLRGEGGAWTDREEMEKWLDMSLLLLRDMAVLKLTEGEAAGNALRENADKDDLLLNSDMRDNISKMAGAADIKGIMNIYDRMAFLKKQMGFNLNKAITWNYTASVVRSVLGSR